MADIGRRGLRAESSVHYEADISSILEALNKMDRIAEPVLQEAANLIVQAGRELLESEFQYAIDQQNQISFPPEFAEHVMEVVSQAPFVKHVSAKSFEIGFDFNELGTVKELRRAFHQGARTADGDVIDGPYEGEELAEPDAETRHLFWEAMATGKSKAPHPHDPAKSIRIPEGAWEETKAKYIDIWGDKAPQWLYLQFGQRRWEPTIQPTNIIEGFTESFNQIASEIFYETVNAAVEEAQNNIFTAPTEHGRRLTSSISELGPSGKPRQAGQFYPKFKGR